MYRLLAVILGICGFALMSNTSPAAAETKAEKLADAAQAEEMAEEMTALLYQPTFPGGHDPDQAFEIEYVVYFGGFHLATLNFTGSITGDAYQIRTQIQTEGVADALVKSNANIGAKGDIDNRWVRPTLYNSDVTDTKQRQLVSMIYNDYVPGKVLSFPEYNLDRFPVDAALKTDTVDPISAIMFILQGSAISTENPCGGQIRIFDGRRRFNMALEFQKTEEVSTGKKGAYHGPAHKCWVGYKKVAGFKPPKTERDKKKRETAKSDWPDVDMWIAEHDSGMRVPVRIQSETSFGIFVARATTLNVTSKTELAADTPRGLMNSPLAPLDDFDMQ